MWRLAVGAVVATAACTEVYEVAGKYTVDPDLADLGPNVGRTNISPKLEVPPSACPFFSRQSSDASAKPCPGQCAPDSCGGGKYCDLAKSATCTTVICSGGASALPSLAWKIVGVRLLPKQQGCDLDGDGKGDSAAGVWADLGLESLVAAAVSKGQLLRALVPDAPPQEGKPFTLAWVYGVSPNGAPACDQHAADGLCPLQGSEQSWSVEKAGTCKPKTVCSASVQAGTLTAKCAALKPGGVPLTAAWAPKTYGVTLTGKLPDGTSKSTLRFCGHWLAADLAGSSFKVGGKAIVVEPDLDFDGVGAKESTSVAAEIDVVAAQLVGVTW